MTFDEAFDRLIGHEGGLSMRADDPGNWTGGKIGIGELKGTKYGIAANTFPHEDIATLTLDRAKHLYQTHYWWPAGCDAVPDGTRFDVFDMAVNSGVRAAIRTLQKAVGEREDGILGPLTLQAVQSMHPARFVARFNGVRLMFMAGLSNWPAAGRGWARRIASNLMEA